MAPRETLAIALCRVSSIEQLENNSLHRQREAIIKAARELNVRIPDDGWWSGSVSSKRGTNVTRKDLQEMLERCKRDKRIKFLIVDEVDRFMRSMLELSYFIIEFKKLGVRIIFASRPDLSADTAADALMLLLEAFKAEGSNEERQRKSIAGQTTALAEGRYPFSPKPGYKKGAERGIQEIHPTRGPALRSILLKLASKQLSPSQALIQLNKSAFMQGHSLYKMDKFRKIVTDPFYAGIVEINKQVAFRNVHGLHEPLITIDQHERIVEIMTGKAKNQTGPRKNGNPNFPCNNHVTCEICKAKKNGRVVGFKHTNGKPNSKIYEKYRCRSCGRYIDRQKLHEAIEQCFRKVQISGDAMEDFRNALDTVWKQREEESKREIIRIEQRVRQLNQAIATQIEAVTDPDNIRIKDRILQSISNKELEIVKLQQECEELSASMDDNKKQFMNFALEFVGQLGSNFLTISPENRLRCKQLLFPAGIYWTKNNKVYTPEISPLITLVTKKKGAEAPLNSHLVRVRGL